MQEDSYYRTVGYMTANATVVECFTAHDKANAFRVRYLASTGRSADQEPNFTVHSPNANKYGVQLRITYHQADGFAPYFGPHSITVTGHYAKPELRRVNSVAYVHELFALGFILGRSQNAARIRARVPDEFVADFDAGLAL